VRIILPVIAFIRGSSPTGTSRCTRAVVEVEPAAVDEPKEPVREDRLVEMQLDGLA
jgi:hypothetical protein